MDSNQYRDFLGLLYLPMICEKFMYLKIMRLVTEGGGVSWWLDIHRRLKRAWTFLPPYSPDLNPIEHVWARIKNKLKEKIFHTKDALAQAVLENYYLVGQDKPFLRALTNSMNRRHAADIEGDGGHASITAPLQNIKIKKINLLVCALIYSGQKI